LPGKLKLQDRKTRTDFQLLAELRAKEAAVLARNGNEEGAHYLAGLAIECALKACIAKKTKAEEFPHKGNSEKVYIHVLNDLLQLAELADLLDRDMKTNTALATNWNTVKGWNVESRYETTGLKGTDMLKAVNSQDGVLQWIKQHW